MDKRIEELREESLVWATENLDPDQLNDNEWSVAINNKFAELLVEEFRDILNEAAQECPLECAGHFLYADEKIAKYFYLGER